jgi:hypothetical protein
MIGYTFKRAILKIKNLILTDFVKEPFPSGLVSGTKNGGQKWLVEQQLASKLVIGTKMPLKKDSFCSTNQFLRTIFVPLTIC